MATLENCPTCEHQTSENADKCPACGEPLAPGWADVIRGERQQWEDELQRKADALTKSKRRKQRIIGWVVIGLIVLFFGPISYEVYRLRNLKEVDPIEYRQKIDALEKEVAGVPASDFAENVRLYLQLRKLDADNPKYAAKIAHYQRKLKDAQVAEEAARKAEEEAKVAEKKAAEAKAKAAAKAVAESAENAKAAALKAQQLAAKAAEADIRSNSWVIDLVYQPNAAVEWIVGVRKTTDREYGYAATVCNYLSVHGIPLKGMNVRIIDFHAFMENGGDHRAASLGQVDCETFGRKYP